MQGYGSGQWRNCRRRAFTLAEVMVATGVMAIASAGIYGSIVASKRMLIAARFHNEAMSVAMDQAMYIANAYPYSTSDPSTPSLLNWPTIAANTTPPTRYAIPHAVSPLLFSRGGTVDAGVTIFSDHVRITVRVYWVDRTQGGVSEDVYVDRYQILR